MSQFLKCAGNMRQKLQLKMFENLRSITKINGSEYDLISSSCLCAHKFETKNEKTF